MSHPVDSRYAKYLVLIVEQLVASANFLYALTHKKPGELSSSTKHDAVFVSEFTAF